MNYTDDPKVTEICLPYSVFF